jgi:hypothetical protein
MDGWSLRLIDDDRIYLDNFSSSHVYQSGNPTPIADLSGGLVRHDGERALLKSGKILDTKTWRRLLPSDGRKYHPDLARFAPDGRFVPTPEIDYLSYIKLIDKETEKVFRMLGEKSFYDQKLGWLGSPPTQDLMGSPFLFKANLYRLPPTDHRDFPPDLIELWVQVAVRGELNEDQDFAKWNEATWEKKRQELAAKPAPYPDFPFPGHVAGDRLHWLRQEYQNAKESDQPALARQLLGRAEAVGDREEAAHWRRVLTPKPDPVSPAAR